MLRQSTCLLYWSFRASSLSSYTHSVFYSLVIALWVCVFAPHWMIVVVCEEDMNCCWIKGTQQRWVWFGTLFTWFSMFHKPSKSWGFCFTLFFFWMCMMLCMCACVCVCVCVNLHSCENLFCWSHVCVRLCYQKDYSESTYPVTQRLRRTPSERNSRSLVCTLYDSSCLFCFSTFYVKCYLFFFLSLSLPLFLSVITLKSCTVFLSRSELLQKL